MNNFDIGTMQKIAGMDAFLERLPDELPGLGLGAGLGISLIANRNNVGKFFNPNTSWGDMLNPMVSLVGAANLGMGTGRLAGNLLSGYSEPDAGSVYGNNIGQMIEGLGALGLAHIPNQSIPTSLTALAAAVGGESLGGYLGGLFND